MKNLIGWIYVVVLAWHRSKRTPPLSVAGAESEGRTALKGTTGGVRE